MSNIKCSTLGNSSTCISVLKSIENELKEIEAALDSLQADVKKEKVLLEQGEVRTYTCFQEEDKEKVGCFLGVVEAIFSLFLCCGVGIVQLNLCITGMSYFGDCTHLQH